MIFLSRVGGDTRPTPQLPRMAAAPSASAVRALALEYKGLNEDPVEGFRVKLVNDEDMFVWEVALFGPPDTLYQGGYFKVNINIRTLQLRSVQLPAVQGAS